MTGGLTEPERAASQRELDILRQRVDDIDTHGTRGVGVIASQVQDLLKDVAEMRTANAVWQASHQTQHKEDERARTAGRRWMVGTVIGLGVLLLAILTLLLQVAGKVH